MNLIVIKSLICFKILTMIYALFPRLPLSQTNAGQLHEIKWVYPVCGFPELTSSKGLSAATLVCKARGRVEERMEVGLTGAVPSAGGSKRGIKLRAVTPKDQKPFTPDGVVVGDESKCVL